MSDRTKARRLAQNNREYIYLSRVQTGDCTFCPRHDIENRRGSSSRWGKKRAMRRCYTTGKTRSLPKKYRAHTWYQANGILFFPQERKVWSDSWYHGTWDEHQTLQKLENDRRSMGPKALSKPFFHKYA